MKALAASSIGQYEIAVQRAGRLLSHCGTGLGACFRESKSEIRVTDEGEAGRDRAPIGAIVFGSDQGLVASLTTWWPIRHQDARRASRQARGSGPWASVCKRVWQMPGLAPLGTFLRTQLRRGASPRWSGQIQIESEGRIAPRRTTRASMSSINRPQSGRALRPVSQRLLPLDAQWLQDRLRQGPLAGRNLPRGLLGRPHHGAARAHPRVSFHFALPRLRGIARQRERQPPGRHGTRRQKYQVTCSQPSSASPLTVSVRRE